LESLEKLKLRNKKFGEFGKVEVGKKKVEV